MGKLDVMGKKNIFGKTKFTLYEISKFIDAKKMAFSFATITTKENATFTIDEENFSFYFKSYSEGDYDKIIREASEWMIKIVRAEDWDHLIYEIKRTTTFYEY